MKMLARLTYAAFACALIGVTVAAAQPAPAGCSSNHPANATPQAIAAVRGTKWAADAQETRTSVLVLSGQVAVRRP